MSSCLISTRSWAQVIGRIYSNENGEPVTMANVTLLSANNVDVIGNAVSDSTGGFSVGKANQGGVLHITCIGYKPYVIQVKANDHLQHISLLRDSLYLNEVIVRAKTFQYLRNGLLIKISGSPLEKLGFASDVLKHLPMISAKNNDYEVIGKGKPLIYINDRLVRDNDELNQLSSSDIRQVKIISNPGAEYDASVRSVIRIITKKPAGEGLGGMADGYVSQERKFSHGAGTSLNYHKGGMEVFASLRYSRDVHTADQRDHTLNGRWSIDDNMKQHSRNLNLNTTLGADYQKEKVSAGIMYKFTRMPSSHFEELENLNAYQNDLLANALYVVDARAKTLSTHYVNAYLNYNINKTTQLKFDMDYYHGNNTTNQSLLDDDGSLNTNNKSFNNLVAGRLTVNTFLWGGEAKAGGEFSYTDDNNNYRVLDATINNSLGSTLSEARQNLMAGFFDYSHSIGEHFQTDFGARYEYINFNYYIDKVKSAESSKIYSGLYPSASLSYSTGDINLTFAYKYLTERPGYYVLRSAVAMNNPYEYESGNPKLQPVRNNNFDLSFSWKDLEISADYDMGKDGVIFAIDHYDNNDSITFFQSRNISSYREISLTLTYAPTLFRIWKPNLTVYVDKNFLTYNSVKYNHPCCFVEFNNMIELPYSYILGLDMNCNTSGNSDVDIVRLAPNFNASAYCIKSFMKDRWRLKMEVSNILNSSREKWSLTSNHISINKWNNGDRRMFKLSLSYRFNRNKSKYKGEAASDEIKRL